MVAGSSRLLSTTKMKLQFAEMSTGGMQAGEQHLQWILCVDSVKNVTTSLHVVKLNKLMLNCKKLQVFCTTVRAVLATSTTSNTNINLLYLWLECIMSAICVGVVVDICRYLYSHAAD